MVIFDYIFITFIKPNLKIENCKQNVLSYIFGPTLVNKNENMHIINAVLLLCVSLSLTHMKTKSAV